MLKRLTIYIILLAVACKQKAASNQQPSPPVSKTLVNNASFDSGIKTIHVFVALCDNKYQGIVPVPAKIGNGQDLDNNLYWGCGMGIRTYFKNSKNWTFIKKYPIDSLKLERAVFKNNKADYYLVADAYNGKNIRECTVDFLRSASGQTTFSFIFYFQQNFFQSASVMGRRMLIPHLNKVPVVSCDGKTAHSS